MQRSLLPIALTLAPTVLAQTGPNDLVLSIWDGAPDVAIVQPDGTVVQTYVSNSSPGRCQGAVLTQNLEILTGRWNPASGLTLFGLSGGEAEVDTPSVMFVADTAVLANGNLLVVDQDGHVDVFTPAGTHLFTMGAGVLDHPWGLFVDAANTVWVGDLGPGLDVFRFQSDGTPMTSLELGISPGDLVRSPDGTLWVIDETTGLIHQFALDGTLLISIVTPLGQHASGLAMEADGTLVASSWASPTLHRFAQDGTALGSKSVAVTGGVLTISSTYPGFIGTSYCGPATQNSSGQAAVIAAQGTTVALFNSLQLNASQMAHGQWGMFLNSTSQGFVMPAGSQGNLCLAGAIGRYNGHIQTTGQTGEFSLLLDLTETPTPGGSVAIQPGETWNFQAWFRDKNPDQTSNFTDGISITFD